MVMIDVPLVADIINSAPELVTDIVGEKVKFPKIFVVADPTVPLNPVKFRLPIAAAELSVRVYVPAVILKFSLDVLAVLISQAVLVSFRTLMRLVPEKDGDDRALFQIKPVPVRSIDEPVPNAIPLPERPVDIAPTERV